MELLAAIGVDSMIAYPTDQALLELSPNDFFQKIIVEGLDAQAMVEGPNFYFGHNRAGNIDTLRTLADEASISLDIVAPYEKEGGIVSSSRIRRLIAEGNVGEPPGDRRTQHHPYQDQRHALPYHLTQHVARSGAQRHADADLVGSPGTPVRDHPIDADCRQTEREVDQDRRIAA